ncbi:hypothetical protein Emed_006675 [Eimeria media]
METLKASHPPNQPDLSVGAFHLHLESAVSTSLQGKSRSPHKAPHSSYLKTSFAVVFLSLTIAYLLWGCFRSLHLNSSLGGTVRALAEGRSPYEACSSGETEEVESEEGAAETESQNESSEGSGSASSSGGPGARGNAASSRPLHARPIAGTWAMQEMPLEWLEKTRRSMHKFKDLAARCALLVSILSPEDSVKLISNMAALACVELGGFAHIPQSVQGVRWNAGRGFVALIERIFRERHLRMAAINTGLEDRLGKLRSLIKEICELPPIAEGVSRRRFKESLVRHWESNKRTTQHVGHHLDTLLSLSNIPGSDLQAQYQIVMQVVRALVETRKMQVAADGVLRRWLRTCQDKIAKGLLYSEEDYKRASRERVQEVPVQLQQITTAVVQAGGSAVVPSYFGNFPSSTQTSSPPQSSSLFSAGASERGDAYQQQQQQRAFSQEHSQAASRVGVHQQQQHSQQREIPPILASMRLVKSQEAFKPTNTGEYYNILGARPRRSPAEEVRDNANVEAEAQALGWGPGVMPPEVATQVLVVLDRVERMATTCSLFLPSLSPDNAVLLSMNLAKWAAAEIASFPLVPPDIQDKKRCAAMRYIALINRIMNDAVTGQAATRLGVDVHLNSLASLHQELINSVPEDPQLTTRTYMRVLMNAWRLSNYASRSVQGLMGTLWPKRNVSGTSRGKAEVVSRVIAALSKIRTTQLLRDFDTCRWFVLCHQKHTPGLLYTEEQFKDARRAGPIPIERALEKITRAINRAHQSATASEQREPSPDPADEASSHGQEQKKDSTTEATRHQPSSSQPPIPHLFKGPKAREEGSQSTSSSFQTLAHGSSPHEQTETSEVAAVARRQHLRAQHAIPRLSRRPKAGEEGRQPVSSLQTFETSPPIRPEQSPPAQGELNPLAAEFSPQHLSRMQPQIPHAMLHPGSGFWSSPAAHFPPPAVPAMSVPSTYQQPVASWLAPPFPLTLAQASHRPLVQTSSALPPNVVWQPYPTSFITGAHYPLHQPFPAGEVQPRVAYVPHQATFPAPWTSYPGESFESAREEAFFIPGENVWMPQGDEGGDVWDLTSQFSTVGFSEEEDQSSDD